MIMAAIYKVLTYSLEFHTQYLLTGLQQYLLKDYDFYNSLNR